MCLPAGLASDAGFLHYLGHPRFALCFRWIHHLTWSLCFGAQKLYSKSMIQGTELKTLGRSQVYLPSFQDLHLFVGVPERYR